MDTSQSSSCIYFAFSDESGGYKKDRSEIFKQRNPYFVRTSIIIRADEFKRIQSECKKYRNAMTPPLKGELKWCYLRNVKHFQEKNQCIPSNKQYYHLKGYSYQQLIQYVSDCLGILCNLNYARIVVTVTDNKRAGSVSEIAIDKMHIQNHMQRIEMELQDREQNLCVLFVDPISDQRDKKLREAYAEILTENAYIRNYSHIKDSLNMEFSHHSVGIQLADYIAGCVTGCLRGFKDSSMLFWKKVESLLRKRKTDKKTMGYGIIEIPRSDTIRKLICDRINETRNSVAQSP